MNWKKTKNSKTNEFQFVLTFDVIDIFGSLLHSSACSFLYMTPCCSCVTKQSRINKKSKSFCTGLILWSTTFRYSLNLSDKTGLNFLNVLTISSLDQSFKWLKKSVSVHYELLIERNNEYWNIEISKWINIHLTLYCHIGVQFIKFTS